MIVTAGIAFICGVAVTTTASAARRAWRRGPVGSVAADERPQELSAGVEAVAPGQWQERYVQSALSEEYVATQTKQIIDEYSCLMSMALTEALNGTQSLRDVTVAAGRSSAAAQETTRSVVSEATRADDLLTTLMESLSRVDGMADLIASVAKRTNLLSLNATIEAARAGEAGKGFAVVAHEVKELATVTARSTTEISGIVDELREEAAAVVTSLDSMRDGVTLVDEAAANVLGLMTAQQAALDVLDLNVHDASSQMELLAMLAGGVDRRKHGRVAAEGAITLDSEELHLDTHLLDLSVGGLRCSLLRTIPLAVGAEVEVTLPLHDTVLRVAAVVRRRTASQGCDHLGMEFTAVTDDDIIAITQYVTHLTRSDPDDEDTDRQSRTGA